MGWAFRRFVAARMRAAPMEEEEFAAQKVLHPQRGMLSSRALFRGCQQKQCSIGYLTDMKTAYMMVGHGH